LLLLVFLCFFGFVFFSSLLLLLFWGQCLMSWFFFFVDVDISTAVEPVAAGFASKSASSSALLPPLSSLSGYVPPTPANTYDNVVGGKQTAQPANNSYNSGYAATNHYDSLAPPAARPKPVAATSTVPAAPFNASAWAASTLDDAPPQVKPGRAAGDRNSESFGFEAACKLCWFFSWAVILTKSRTISCLQLAEVDFCFVCKLLFWVCLLTLFVCRRCGARTWLYVFGERINGATGVFN
jgi:hypothetical protein